MYLLVPKRRIFVLRMVPLVREFVAPKEFCGEGLIVSYCDRQQNHDGHATMSFNSKAAPARSTLKFGQVIRSYERFCDSESALQ